MATLKQVLHLHAHYTNEGKFQSWYVAQYKLETKLDGGGFFVWVQEYPIELGIPDTPPDNMALKAIKAETERLQTEFRGKMIILEMIKNNLLHLGHSEILDAVPAGTPRAPLYPEADDDIPF